MPTIFGILHYELDKFHYQSYGPSFEKILLSACPPDSSSIHHIPGCLPQSVTFLTADTCLTADPVVVSSIEARSHTFVEIDHEIISTAILLPSAD